jgi:hypothetical protein
MRRIFLSFFFFCSGLIAAQETPAALAVLKNGDVIFTGCRPSGSLFVQPFLTRMHANKTIVSTVRFPRQDATLPLPQLHQQGQRILLSRISSGAEDTTITAMDNDLLMRWCMFDENGDTLRQWSYGHQFSVRYCSSDGGHYLADTEPNAGPEIENAYFRQLNMDSVPGSAICKYAYEGKNNGHDQPFALLETSGGCWYGSNHIDTYFGKNEDAWIGYFDSTTQHFTRHYEYGHTPQKDTLLTHNFGWPMYQLLDQKGDSIHQYMKLDSVERQQQQVLSAMAVSGNDLLALISCYGYGDPGSVVFLRISDSLGQHTIWRNKSGDTSFQPCAILPTPDGYLIGGTLRTGLHSAIQLIRCDKKGNVLRSATKPIGEKDERLAGIATAPDGSWWLLGQEFRHGGSGEFEQEIKLIHVTRFGRW